MYGCSMDQRLILPRPRPGSARSVVGSGLNAIPHHDRSARSRRPWVLRILDHLHDPVQRRGALRGVDMLDVGVRPWAMEYGPNGASPRDLDDLMLPGVHAELHVNGQVNTLYEVDALAHRGPEVVRLDRARLNHDLPVRGPRGRHPCRPC